MQKLDKLNFLTAGFPSITKGNIFGAIESLNKLKLDGMELEFVHNIWLKKDKELLEKIKNEKKDLVFTAHAPYYVNLASDENQKVGMGKAHIGNSAEMCYLVNGYSITFHSGFYMKQPSASVYKKIKDNVKIVVERLKEKGVDIWVRPETTGKETQFGNLEECIKLSEDIEMVLPCVDFAHLHARYGGINNTKEEWANMLNLLEKRLGKTYLNNMHIHMSGINYTQKGERNHLTLEDSDIHWKVLLDTLKDYNVKGALINESPNIEVDALKMKKYYYK